MKSQEAPTHQRTADGQERLVDLRPPLVSDAQPATLVPPRERALDDPTLEAQTAAVLGTALGEPRGNAACPQRLPMGRRVIRPIASDALGALARPTRLAPTPRHRVDPRHQLGHILGLCCGQEGRERQALCVRNDMVRAPQLPSLRRLRARVAPPSNGANR